MVRSCETCARRCKPGKPMSWYCLHCDERTKNHYIVGVKPIDEFTKYIANDVNTTNSVFKTIREADEALAKKYGGRKDYNNMNGIKKISVCINGEHYGASRVSVKKSPFEYDRYEIEAIYNPEYRIKEAPGVSISSIKDVIFNPPATIVFWMDGSKTVVKANGGDEFDPEKGLAMAIAKKALGNQGNYFNAFKDYIHKYNMSLFKDEMHEYVDEVVLEVIEHGASGDAECKPKLSRKELIEKIGNKLKEDLSFGFYKMLGDSECQTK